MLKNTKIISRLILSSIIISTQTFSENIDRKVSFIEPISSSLAETPKDKLIIDIRIEKYNSN